MRYPRIGRPARSVRRACPSRAPDGGYPFMQSNQNLLYLVLKCVLNTKHSGSRKRVQALFDAQKRGVKTAAKTAFCGALRDRCTYFPPAIHSTVHRSAAFRSADERRDPRCSFATALMRVCASAVEPRSGRRVQALTGSANSLVPAIATIRSPGDGATVARPVNPPNAGRIARAHRARSTAARSLLAAAVQTHPRVNVPAQRVAGRRRDWRVAGEKRGHRVRVVAAFDRPRRRRIAGARVVVAADEHDVDRACASRHSRDRAVECRQRGPPARAGNRRARRRASRPTRSISRGQPREVGRRRRRAAAARRAARNVADLPRCTSATNSVRSRGQ